MPLIQPDLDEVKISDRHTEFTHSSHCACISLHLHLLTDSMMQYLGESDKFLHQLQTIT